MTRGKRLATPAESVDERRSDSGDGWTMHAGDCIAGLASLADDSVDVTITDPPYEAEAHTKMRRQKGKCTVAGSNVDAYRSVSTNALNFGAITEAQRTAVAAEIGRVTRGWAVVFCQVEAIGAWRTALAAGGMKYRRSIPWVKPDAMPSLHGRWPGQAFEAIVAASKHDEPDWNAIILASRQGAMPCPLGGKAIEYRFTRAQAGQPGGPGGTKAPHPTTKPLPLMLKLVEHFTRQGDVVLDPFAGSATTGVACRQMGRRFIGWELFDGTIEVLDENGLPTFPNYYDVACRRLRGEAGRVHESQGELFAAGVGA